MRFIRLFLLPVSILYYWATGIRNWLYDQGYFKSFDLDVSSIVVGNLTVGGTGKTPFIEYLIRTLHPDFKITTLSRGYKRKSRGLVIAGDQDTARTIGDEPYQFQKKFGHTIGVAVCEDRLFAIPHILQARPDTNLILLDDAYQHRQVKPSCNLLISDYNKLFYKDYLLPAGNLREPRNGALRADAVIVTKCPENISESETVEIEEAVQRYTRPGAPVYFMNTQYEPVIAAFNGSAAFTDNVLLVTAIADPKPLVDHVNRKYTLVNHIRYPDHHYFTKKDCHRIIRLYGKHEQQQPSILFSEKDIVRISGTDLEDILMDYPVFFQPITYKFAQSGSEFDDFIRKMLVKTDE